LNFEEYLIYAKSEEGKKLAKEIGVINIVKNLFFGLPLLYRIYFNSRKMTRKWSANGYHQYMDTPLVEIQKRLNFDMLKYGSQLLN